jgi:integrase
VQAQMRAEMALADKGTPVFHSKGTTGSYLEHWLKFVAPTQIRDTTLQLYTSIIRTHLIPRLGNIPLTQLKPDHIRTMLTAMKKSEVGDRTAQQARNILSAALRDAMAEGTLHRNVARLVPAPKYESKERKHWTKEQVAQFFEAAKPHRYYVTFLLLLSYGLRRGEVLGLSLKNLDFENGLIKIRQTLQLINGKVVIGPLKTKASKRDLPMLPFIKAALLECLRTAEQYDDGLLFHTSAGKPVCPTSLIKMFKRLARQAGLPPISVHEARHTAATLLYRAWRNPKDVSTIMGHEETQITENIYVHSDIENMSKAMAAYTAGLM